LEIGGGANMEMVVKQNMVMVYLRIWNGKEVKVVYGERDNGCDQRMSVNL
jgi:hypothetical protein